MGHRPWQRLLLIRPGALGDTLLLLPTLALARQQWPGLDITLVAREDVAQLALTSGLADHIAPYGAACWSALFNDEPRLIGPEHVLHTVVNGSAVVAWMPDFDGVVARNLHRLGAEPVILASGRPDPTSIEHMATTLSRGLEPLGLTLLPEYGELAWCIPRLATTYSDMAKIDGLWQALTTEQRLVAVFHAGSGGAAKRWPPHLYARLAEESEVHGLTPILICGPQDEGSTRDVIAACAAISHLPVVKNLSLGQLSALLQRSAVYIGNDSGVTHLAALAGVPTLALFGPTNPACWAPIGRQVHILCSPTGQMADISPGAAWNALQSLL